MNNTEHKHKGYSVAKEKSHTHTGRSAAAMNGIKICSTIAGDDDYNNDDDDDDYDDDDNDDDYDDDDDTRAIYALRWKVDLDTRSSWRGGAAPMHKDLV